MDSADSGRSRMPVAGILSCYRSEWISVDLGQFALLVNSVAADGRYPQPQRPYGFRKTVLPLIPPPWWAARWQ
jgi:hypothetical protein